MKALYLGSLILLMSAVSFAFEAPLGDFHYTNSQALRTKHFHRLYQKKSQDKKLIETYKANAYTCKRLSSFQTECSKIIETNPNKLDFTSEKLAKLSPFFSKAVENIKELSTSDAVTRYEIEQEHISNSYQSAKYKAFDIKNNGFYIDLKINEFKKARFEVLNQRVLSHFSHQKEKLNKKEYYLHSLISYYIK